ncbi:hypothetical protein CCR90_10250 [Rhodovulum sulfidophilum]|uniref:hypothetical protein n=1 Tax=Rhodovulum sulfidophilum TaxID=35806 RepID=UPI001912A44E|nr:hypothetical protein [Rhodovulum sulfidophilum]MBK5924146.1 hypothetical protein [Rhodovulum sulfidophilum]
MTFTSPAFLAANPFWAANVMFDQQMRLFQASTDFMLRANPWALMMRAGGFDPLTADSGLSRADCDDEIPLNAGVASGGGEEAEPSNVSALSPTRPEPAAEPSVKAAAEPSADPAVEAAAETVAEPAVAASARTSGQPSVAAAPAPAASNAPAGSPPVTAPNRASGASPASVSEPEPEPAMAAAAPAAATASGKARLRGTAARKGSSPRAARSGASGRGRRKPASPQILPGDGSGPEGDR